MPPSSSSPPLSWKWILLGVLLLVGIALAIVLGPGTETLVTPEGVIRP
jgi:hypothetical protein